MYLGGMKTPSMVNGLELSPAAQQQAFRQFVHRYTGEHRPYWVISQPVQFKDDADWLAHTRFYVTRDGNLCKGRSCYSTPTWPNNPELRRFSFGEHGAIHEAAK
jgi:hypothetical protein